MLQLYRFVYLISIKCEIIYIDVLDNLFTLSFRILLFVSLHMFLYSTYRQEWAGNNPKGHLTHSVDYRICLKILIFSMSFVAAIFFFRKRNNIPQRSGCKDGPASIQLFNDFPLLSLAEASNTILALIFFRFSRITA